MNSKQPDHNEKSPAQEHGWNFCGAAKFCCHCFDIGSLLAGLMTFPMVFISLVQILVGIVKCGFALWESVFNAAKQSAPQHDLSAVVLILHGLELLLLSPLPYLILSSMAEFVREWGFKKVISENTHAKLNGAKILLYGSFFGLLSLDLISKELADNIDIYRGMIELAGLLLIACFFFGLEVIPAWKKNGLG